MFTILKGNANLLEKVQRKALKAIYGYDKDYTDILNESGLTELHDRREKAFEKFTRKTLKKTNTLTGSPKTPSKVYPNIRKYCLHGRTNERK